jgi:CheY-like chemotaxis protein
VYWPLCCMSRPAVWAEGVNLEGLLKGLNVLIVEDNQDSRELLRMVLEYCGAVVTAAASAREAVGIVQSVKPDVVVSDIAMPSEDGYWLMDQIRKLPDDRGGKIPALALTAFRTEHNEERALAAGFQSYARKPVDPSELCRLVAGLGGRAA